MLSLRERLLLPVDAEEGKTSSCGEVSMLSCTQMLGLGIAFTVGVCAGPHIIAGGAMPMPESVSDEAATQLMGTPESFGAIKKVYVAFKPCAPFMEYFGILLFCLPFLLFGYTHAKDFSGFAGWLGSMGLPLPKILAAVGVVTLLLGPLFLLSEVTMLVQIAAQSLGLFLLVATYFGHIVPLRSAEKGSWPYLFNVFMLLDNITLYGALGVIGWRSAAHVKAYKAHAPLMSYVSLVIFSIGFLVAALMHLKDFNNFEGWVGSLGLPIPAKVGAVSGIAMLLIGCGMLYTGCPLLESMGAEFLLFFLLGATYYGHYKPMQAADEGSQDKQEQFMLILKNIGMMGGCLEIMGLGIERV